MIPRCLSQTLKGHRLQSKRLPAPSKYPQEDSKYHQLRDHRTRIKVVGGSSKCIWQHTAKWFKERSHTCVYRCIYRERWFVYIHIYMYIYIYIHTYIIHMCVDTHRDIPFPCALSKYQPASPQPRCRRSGSGGSNRISELSADSAVRTLTSSWRGCQTTLSEMVRGKRAPFRPQLWATLS